jgi:hypothetical protein
MKVLFDQGTPLPLRKHLDTHTVSTAFECGWSTMENGELIKKAEVNGYNLLITTDQNLKYQQNLNSRRIAILVLKSTSWPRILKHIDAIVSAVSQISDNDYIEIEIEK